MITEAEFRALAAQGYNRIPLVLESFADLDTPLSLYLKLANARYSFLLESVVGGERFGRYSFIGLPAKVRIRARGTRIEVERRRRRASSATTAIRSRSSRYLRALPRRAAARACRASAAASPAYFGYDTVRHIETQLARHGASRRRRPRRRARHPAAAHRGARGRRQPAGQDLAHRLRRSGASPTRTRARTTRLQRAAPQAARAGGDSASRRRRA